MPAHRYTHGHDDSVLRSHSWRTVENSAAYLLPHLSEDMSLLDIGAGPGTITADFAAIVGHVTATETGEDQLALSRATVADRWVGNVDFAVADIHALDFPDDTFDVAHAHQVLQHVADPVGALKEMARVTRPGGLVAVRDSDYSGFAWSPQFPALDDWMALYQRVSRANGGEPDAGRRLLSWARKSGLADVVSTSSTWCYASPEDRQWWGSMWADRILDSAFARQAVREGFATRADLERISEAWWAWADDGDGWFSLLHGELLARVHRPTP